MRRLPLFDNFRKRRLDFIWVVGKPAQFRADGLFFEFGTSPNEGGADDGSDDAQPVILNEERCNNDEDANSHHVGPPEIAKISFAANDEGEAKPDDEQGEDADENAE